MRPLLYFAAGFYFGYSLLLQVRTIALGEAQHDFDREPQAECREWIN